MKIDFEFLTPAAIARKTDRPVSRVLKLIKTGALNPDCKVGRYFLFTASRLPDIQKMLTLNAEAAR